LRFVPSNLHFARGSRQGCGISDAADSGTTGEHGARRERRLHVDSAPTDNRMQFEVPPGEAAHFISGLAI
jgi:hypothetical protein